MNDKIRIEIDGKNAKVSYEWWGKLQNLLRELEEVEGVEAFVKNFFVTTREVVDAGR